MCCYCFLIGFLIGKLVTLKKDLDTSSTNTALDPTKTYWKIVRYRKGTKEWEKNIDDPAVAYSRKLNQFSDFLINVIHAKAHMND